MCGGLNKKNPHRLIDLNAWSPGCGTFEVTRRWHLVGIGMLLLGSVSLEVAFDISRAQAHACLSLFLMPVDLDIELSTSLATCLPVYHYAPCHGDNELSF